jgi:competence protein ComEC
VILTSARRGASPAKATFRLVLGLLALGLLTVVLVGAAALSGGAGPGHAAGGTGEPADVLELAFLDVGQGDAVLIRTPDGRAVLYDGGPDGALLLEHLERAGVASLELVVASHNHADHIGGLADVTQRYRPRYVLENGIPHTTRTYERFLRALIDAGTRRLEPTRREITLGEVRLTVIPPPGDPALGQNDNSVGLLVTYGRFRATLLGDSEPAQQEWWLERHADLLDPVQVHKASHHGSRHGDTRALLERLRPGIVVVSAGRDNHYDHPRDQALARYQAVGAMVYRTDRDGTVTVRARADGAVDVVVSSGTAGPL